MDKVWASLAKLLQAHFPFLGGDTLRALRILTLFARELVSDEVKEQVTTLFASWWRRQTSRATGKAA